MSNAEEIRGFRSVHEWTQTLAGHGLRRLDGGEKQAGDPTDNVLMVFERV